MKAKKILACILAVVMLVLPLSSCSANGKAVMTFRGTELSTNMFSYMLSSQKAYINALFNYYNYYYYQSYGAYYFGTNDFDTYLSETYTDDNGETMTNAENMMSTVVNSAKMYLIVNNLCESHNVSVTDESALEQIDEYIEDDVSTAGNEYYLNILLSQYGASVDIEKDYLMNQAKATALYEYLYGTNGTQRIDDSKVKELFEENYGKFDSVYFPFYTTNDDDESVLVTDDSITDEVLRENFNKDYRTFKHILFYYYDLTSGTEISDEAKQIKRDSANGVYDDIINGNITFEDAQAQYDEDTVLIKDKGTLCVTVGTMADDNVYDKLGEMEIGETAVVESKIGTHIIVRVENTEEDYEDKKDTIKTELTKENIKKSASDFLENYQDGKIEFNSEVKFGTYEEGECVETSSIESELEKKFASLGVNEATDYEVEEKGIFVFRKLATDDDDYKEFYDDLYEELAQDDFYDYIESFYNEIVVDEEELAKYNFLTAEILDITAFSDLFATSEAD